LESYRRGVDWTVDHIIGLTAKNNDGKHIACGLNVPWNLQVLHNVDNAKKGQKLVEA